MSYPTATNLSNTFKVRTLEAQSSSSGAVQVTVTVPFRSKYLFGTWMYNLNAVVPNATGASTAVNIAINGSTAIADSYFSNPVVISTSTTTGSTSANLPGSAPFSTITPNATPLYLSQGDTITTIGTTSMPYAVVHVLQEF